MPTQERKPILVTLGEDTPILAEVLLHQFNLDGSQIILLQTEQRESVRNFISSELVATVNHENLHLSEETPKAQPIVQTTEKYVKVVIGQTDIQGFRVFRTNKTPISYKLNIHLETLAKCENLAEAIKMVGEVPPFPLAIKNIQFTLDYPLQQPVMVEIRQAESVIEILYHIARVYMDIIYGSKTNEYGIWGHGIEDLVFEGIDIQESNSSLLSKIYLGS